MQVVQTEAARDVVCLQTKQQPNSSQKDSPPSEFEPIQLGADRGGWPGCRRPFKNRFVDWFSKQMIWSLPRVSQNLKFYFQIDLQSCWGGKRGGGRKNQDRPIVSCQNRHWRPALIVSCFSSSIETRLEFITAPAQVFSRGLLLLWEQQELCCGQLRTYNKDKVTSDIILISVNFCDLR